MNRRSFFAPLFAALASLLTFRPATAGLKLPAPRLFKSRSSLLPVGIDTDGNVKPIDQLSFIPPCQHDMIGPGQLMRWSEEKQRYLYPLVRFNGQIIEAAWASPSAGAAGVYVTRPDDSVAIDLRFVPSRVRQVVVFGDVTVEWLEEPLSNALSQEMRRNSRRLFPGEDTE